MSEIVRGGILAVDPGQFEAATALGMTHGQTMRKVVLHRLFAISCQQQGMNLLLTSRIHLF
mgnify:FL=1